jgi:pimeloyl-ACP methyl ester carboxylesterase
VSRSTASSELRGASRLIIDAVIGITNIVESMHRNISGLAPIVGQSRQGSTKGITGLTYRSVRGVSRVVGDVLHVGLGAPLDVALAQLAPLLKTKRLSALSSMRASLQREAVLAAVNGVFGDYLVATSNPLAITMRLRKDGQPLTLDRSELKVAFPQAKAKPTKPTRLVILVHGLCMNDHQWQRDGHDHGSTLDNDLDCTTLYLHYNTGRHISQNGREFADLLERLVHSWPVPIDELIIIGHSMGGLVSRSAHHYATLAGHAWPQRLRKLVFLGTPHHGAPLERAGSWVDLILGVSPYTAPLARLGKIRSAGVQDLRYGYVVDEDWNGGSEARAGESRAGETRAGESRSSKNYLPLPKNVKCFAVAATTQLQPGRTTRLRGDGLVPVASALGQHEDAKLSLRFPKRHQHVCFALNHFDLLSSREVYDQVLRWLSDKKS